MFGKRKKVLVDKGFGIGDKDMQFLNELDIPNKLNKFLIEMRSVKYASLINASPEEYASLVGELKGVEDCMNALHKMNTYQKNLNKNKEK